MKGILGKKIGMTQIFSEAGEMIPVTVIEAGPCVVTQLKNEETDGYKAVQLGFEDQKEHRLTKPERGHFAKAGVACKKYLGEFRLSEDESYELGQTVSAADFEEGAKLDITGTSKGKGTSRVFLGNKAPGRTGRDTVTVQNLELVKVIADRNLMLVKGAVPGNKGGLLRIRMAVKGQTK